ncbi:hypothetical protein KUTeg_014317 [Tegillarca granosa]|uniref:Bifunctional lysine-specific demethylase and histidyl-hydroxylase n=1 Tax=Tegillarca granosa TaxID=220873 RepID=A0ABQ9EWA5_TEGGR|nr:hypothetical protein KUTeg_014317 [Tegillarca granosa]
MRKVSAFAVFKSKKEKGDTPRSVNNDSIDNTDLKRASSTPSITDSAKQLKGKKVLRVLKGGSLRNSIRTTPKKRPTILKASNDVAMDTDAGSVKLTSLKSNSDIKPSTKKAIDKRSDDTPKLPPRAIKPRKDATITLPPKGKPLVTSPKAKNTDLNTSGQKSKSSLKSPKVNSPKPQAKVLPNGKAETLSPKAVNGENIVLHATNKTATQNNITSPKSNVKSPKSAASSETKPAGIKSPKLNGKRPIEDNDSGPNKKKRVEKHDCTPEDVTNPSFDEEDSVLPYMYDSREEARKIFKCVIHPVKPEKFFKELWERKPLLVKRHLAQYNDGWFSTAELDRILRENGCSVRLLNPQTYSQNVWKLLSVLQEYFNCCVGANVYLTPAGTQGFAPHFDDIEAFILQLEGKKHWRLYSPRTDSETLPRYSSGNFKDEGLGEPILEVTLEPGDLLYFPRGTIHQGRTLEDNHSLHITVSCYQKNTWGDLFEKLIPRALQIAIDEDVEFRKGLPRDYLHYMGIANSEAESPQRKAFLLEKLCSIYGGGEKWDPVKSCVTKHVEIEPDTHVKIIRKGVIRIYHSLDNVRLFHATEPQYLEIAAELAPAVEYLLHSYPEFVSLGVVTSLYEKGILITGEPLEPLDSDPDDEH